MGQDVLRERNKKELEVLVIKTGIVRDVLWCKEAEISGLGFKMFGLFADSIRGIIPWFSGIEFTSQELKSGLTTWHLTLAPNSWSPVSDHGESLVLCAAADASPSITHRGEDGPAPPTIRWWSSSARTQQNLYSPRGNCASRTVGGGLNYVLYSWLCPFLFLAKYRQSYCFESAACLWGSPVFPAPAEGQGAEVGARLRVSELEVLVLVHGIIVYQ